jgi:transcription elongation factor GreA-like protein
MRRISRKRRTTCREIYREIIEKICPEKLETYYSLEKKLNKHKDIVDAQDCITPTPDEWEVFLLIVEELTKIHEEKHGTLSDILELLRQVSPIAVGV